MRPPSCAFTCVMVVSICGTSLSDRASLRSGAARPVLASMAHGSVGAAGVDRGTVQRLHRGGSTTWRIVCLVAQALNVDPATLLAETEEPTP